MPEAEEIAAVVEVFKRTILEDVPNLSKDDLPPLLGALIGAHYACVDRYQPRPDGKKWRGLLREFSERLKKAKK